jgi:hypothetical protein
MLIIVRSGKETDTGLTQLAYYFQFVVRALALILRTKVLTTNYKSDFFVTLA